MRSLALIKFWSTSYSPAKALDYLGLDYEREAFLESTPLISTDSGRNWRYMQPGATLDDIATWIHENELEITPQIAQTGRRSGRWAALYVLNVHRA